MYASDISFFSMLITYIASASRNESIPEDQTTCTPSPCLSFATLFEIVIYQLLTRINLQGENNKASPRKAAEKVQAKLVNAEGGAVLVTIAG
jgi:hypothetical protein